MKTISDLWYCDGCERVELGKDDEMPIGWIVSVFNFYCPFCQWRPRSE